MQHFQIVPSRQVWPRFGGASVLFYLLESCQKPICMRPANVLEIKAPTCQVNSLHLYEAVKLFHLPLSQEIKGPPGRGAREAKQRMELLGVWIKKRTTDQRSEERGARPGGAQGPRGPRPALCYLQEPLSEPGAPGAHSFTLRTAGEDIHSLFFFFWWRSRSIHVFLTLNNFCL